LNQYNIDFLFQYKRNNLNTAEHLWSNLFKKHNATKSELKKKYNFKLQHETGIKLYM